MPETKYFERTIKLSPQSEPAGTEFPAKLAYWTFGNVSNAAVLLPTCYGGSLETTTPFLYSDSHTAEPILPPSKYFIIVTGLLGGGESSSPSNTPAPWNGPNFPHTTYEDNVRLQYALCESLGVKRLFAYIGFSMGGQQAYHMSTIYPDFVENMACLAGSAKTSWHNWCFLEGPKHALIAAVDFEGGHYKQPAKQGVKAFFRVYSTWALSQEWFRQRCWEEVGFKTLQEYLEANWSGGAGADANDLLALLWTWQHGDITLYYPEDDGDLAKTLGRIKAKCLIFPARTDQYFPPEDNEEEVKHLKQGVFKCIETPYGHIAGGGSGRTADTECIIREVKQFLRL
jgi:homoserine acetyltransferase